MVKCRACTSKLVFRSDLPNFTCLESLTISYKAGSLADQSRTLLERHSIMGFVGMVSRELTPLNLLYYVRDHVMKERQVHVIPDAVLSHFLLIMALGL